MAAKNRAEAKIPAGVTAEADAGVLRVSGPNGKLEKKFDSRTISVAVANGTITVSTSARKSRKGVASVNTIAAHAKNMVNGVTKGYEKKLTVVFAHFPISVETKGKEVLIKNFLGEKLPRTAKIVDDTKVTVSGQEITVTGPDKEAVGQTAANILESTVVRERDERVFQDGIYYA
jgi:large subunit ribosomal protein L6